MEILPAIDLRQGKVVRLNQGDFDRQTTFSDDPIAIAQGFVEAGATRIHIVDLDGALEGGPRQTELYVSIARSVGVPIELGGGIRTGEDVGMVLGTGIDRVVLGTAAIEDPGMVARAILEHGADRIVVGLDANEGKVAVAGWRETTDRDATDLMSTMVALGVQRFVFTDIARDGTLTEPNFASVAKMIEHGRTLGGVHVIASGGIGSIDHLKRLAELGAESAIVGTAIYRGTVDLHEAISTLQTL
ncbi:MAG: 1-(5-phosphoribosyl)-5-[(5-phosphoribosylamino)methylideneamino]imidazole-4-carboxamide isomerase [Chloroflexi bacterium]|nr:1-(5-phosphoribosyl)-5-[(5-phosphoribosylamino)methylideneamino]imidazole-4-carboxamide isomerase [Chloroflexota bacterium]